MPIDRDSLILAIISASLLIALFALITFLIAVSYSRRKRRFEAEREMREAFYRQELLQAQMEMQEHTFKIISQDIHDNVGQILSLAKINLNIISLEQQENEAFLRIKDLVTNAITELRHLGTGYYAERLADQGLIDAIRHQLDQIAKTGMFVTSFHSDVEHVRVEKNDLIFLYRIVQEVLNNVIKHSDATEVRIGLTQQADEVMITVADNGRGFARDGASFRPGIGLSSIEQRATMIGAKAIINSAPGKGTEVLLSFKQKPL